MTAGEDRPLLLVFQTEIKELEVRSRPKVITRRVFLANTGALIAATGARLPLFARIAAGRADTATPSELLLGVDYYPDQTPETLWHENARMIAETGFTNVRVAEFAWSLMEPSEGKFDFGAPSRGGDAAEAWDSGDSRHAIGGSSSVAYGKISGRSDGERSRDDGSSGRATIYLPDEQGLSPLDAGDCYRDGTSICGHAWCDRLAD